MSLNPFFLQGSSGEQNLVQDLINEQLRMYGVEVYYIPRKYITEKTVIKEVIESKFDNAYPIEAYVNNFEGYGDNTQLLSKFGIQATNELSLIISKERFDLYISPLMKNLPNIKLSTRPKEGDLIYFPLGERLFEIKFVEHEQPFYQLQKNYTYELKCELFRYEDEIIDIETGIEELDEIASSDANLKTLSLVGTSSTATAITSIVNGGVSSIIMINRGEKYISAPTVAISSSPVPGGTAIGIATMISGLTNCDGSTSGYKVQGVQIVNPGYGYTVSPGIMFIGGGGSGAAATTIISDSAIGIVTITDGGSGYTTSPNVTIGSPGIGTTAIGLAVVSSAGTISAIRLVNSGFGYTTTPSINIESPSASGYGDFIHGETITGSSSSTTAIVNIWDLPSYTLKISNISGDFIIGEFVTGSESGAYYKVNGYNEYNDTNSYPQNEIIEEEASQIIDFSELNPFGNP